MPPLSHGNEVEFSQQDIEKWRKGALKFAEFWSQAKDEIVWIIPPELKDQTELLEDMNLQRVIGDLEAVFLGEKPSVLLDPELGERFPKYLLEKYGLKQFEDPVFKDSIIYNEEAVNKVIRENREIFKNCSAQEAFESIYTASDTMELHFRRGLLLGYPRNASAKFSALNYIEIVKRKKNGIIGKFFQKTEIKKVTTATRKKLQEMGILEVSEKDRVFFRTCGISWADFDSQDPDSLALQKRLNNAFEISGILQLVPDGKLKQIITIQ